MPSEQREYIGTKRVLAVPTKRGTYNAIRGWKTPEDEDQAEDGYLVEYLDGGKPNHPAYEHYISWSPKDVFERSYRPVTRIASISDETIDVVCIVFPTGEQFFAPAETFTNDNARRIMDSWKSTLPDDVREQYERVNAMGGFLWLHMLKADYARLPAHQKEV